MPDTKILSTRLPINIADIIDSIAKERNRKKGEIIKEAIEMYIGEWADYKIAIDRFKNPADKILKEEEFLNELKGNFNWRV